MSAQHTPGPWFTDPNDATKVLKQFRSPKVRNETIAATNRTWMTEREKIGNARLIAAAPELLEALERLIASGDVRDAAEKGAITQASAAIAKVHVMDVPEVDDTALLRQALEEEAADYADWIRTMKAARTALAEPEPRNQCGETCERAKLCAVCAGGLAEQEPVAWGIFYFGGKRNGQLYSQLDTEENAKRYISGLHQSNDTDTFRAAPLYTAPQPRRNVTYVCPVCAASLERQE